MSNSEFCKVSDIEARLGVINSKKADKVKFIEVLEIITLLERCNYCNANNKYASLFLGSTKCGKSTTLNLLLGNVLKVIIENDPKVPKFIRCIKLRDEKENDGTFPVIGRTTHSETTVPKKFTIKIRGIYYDLWDCCGTGDTRGAPQVIISGWLVSRLFETAKGVKLFSLFSAEALLSPNTQEFRSFIQQIQDLFGLENIDSISPTLVFTKANWNTPIDDLKEVFLYLLSEHFPNSKELHNLFNKAKVVKIIKPVNDDVGHEYTKDHVSSLIETFDIEDFQKMKPHVAVDADAKNFILESFEELGILALETMKNAYLKLYQDEVKHEIEKTFIQLCTEKNFMELTQQFIKAKQDSIDKMLSHSLIKEAEEILDKIMDFVLTIIPENNFLEDLMKRSKEAVKYYNIVVFDYNAFIKYLNFLKQHSTNITSKLEFCKIWDNIIEQLKKPESCLLSQSLTEMYSKCKEANQEITKLHEKENLKAKREVIEKAKKYLTGVQLEYGKKMKDYANAIAEAADPSGLAAIPVLGYAVNTAIKVHRWWHDCPEPIQPEHKTVSIPKVSKILDKSFSQYIEENPLWLLGDIEKYYWEQ